MSRTATRYHAVISVQQALQAVAEMRHKCLDALFMWLRYNEQSDWRINLWRPH
jgi:hypothetical protein